MKIQLFFTIVFLLVFAQSCANTPTPTATTVPSQSPTPLPAPTPTPDSLIPDFEHIVWILFENKEFGSVIGKSSMPYYNQLAREFTLLTQYYAVRHPSLPNYIALIGGDTFGIDRNCKDCFVDEPSLPDLIEDSGRTWKTYQEDMPSPCYLGDKKDYVQKHNPFVYFDNIRLDAARCTRSVVPLTALQTDIETDSLPNFLFIKPNLCNDSHDCSLKVSDAWLKDLLAQLVPALDATGDSYVIFMLFEEGQSDRSCCGLPEEAGGRVPVVIYSPLVKNGFEDDTQYTHYSLLKTISQAWGLPYLGHAADDNHVLIISPWK